MILVTGPTGFVGKALVSRLRADGHEVRVVSRDAQACNAETVLHVSSIDEATDWRSALKGVDVVIHCAARAHRMHDPDDTFQKYKSVNTDGTLKLARECAAHGVRRFVFVSTIKVCAESTSSGQILTPDMPLKPEDWYGQSKADAEAGLKEIANSSPLELVIVRPPLVYGPGAKGNLSRLVKLVSLQLPLPLGAIHNKRSIVGLTNLVDFLTLVTHHPKAGGQIFNVSDGTTVSTTQILRILAAAMKKRSLLIPVPATLLNVAGKLTQKPGYVKRLTSNLEVDSSNCFDLLEWKPPLSIEDSVSSLVDVLPEKTS